jgi:hypothetical protein
MAMNTTKTETPPNNRTTKERKTMRIKIERCFGDKASYRATVLKDGARYVFTGDYWSRAMAIKLRDHIVRDYGVKRSNIRLV